MLLLSLACAPQPGLLPSLGPDAAWATLPAEASLKAGLSLDGGEAAALEGVFEAAGLSVAGLRSGSSSGPG